MNRLSESQRALLAKMAADSSYVPRPKEWRTEDALRASGLIVSVPRDGGIGSRAVLTDTGRAAIGIAHDDSRQARGATVDSARPTLCEPCPMCSRPHEQGTL